MTKTYFHGAVSGEAMEVAMKALNPLFKIVGAPKIEYPKSNEVKITALTGLVGDTDHLSMGKLLSHKRAKDVTCSHELDQVITVDYGDGIEVPLGTLKTIVTFVWPETAVDTAVLPVISEAIQATVMGLFKGVNGTTLAPETAGIANLAFGALIDVINP